MSTYPVHCAPRATATTWPVQEMTWEQLVTKVRAPASRKECGGYVPGTLRGDVRDRTHVESRWAATLDADYADEGFLDRVAAMGYRLICHPTWRHTTAAPRYRVIVPLDAEVSADHYPLVVASLMDRLGGAHLFDQRSRMPEQFMWWPSTRDKTAYRGALRVLDGSLAPSEELRVDGALLGDPTPGEARTGRYVYDGPDRDPQQGVHPYAAKAIRGELARLDALERDGWDGEGWDNATFAVACNLIEFANSGWTGYDLDTAKTEFLEHAPTDAGFTPRHHESKWSSATHTVGSGGRPAPATSTAQDDFDVVDTDTGEAPRDDPDAPLAVDPAVAKELQRLQVRQEAQRLFRQQQRGGRDLPQLVRLDALLAEPDEDVSYRVDGLWPTGGRVLLAARKKSGKSTMVGNVVRALVDGEEFLGRYGVQPARRVVVVDNELSRGMLRRWLRDHGIRNDAAVDLLPLRGHMSAFDILDPATRASWAERIGPADVLVFDCLRPALDALGLSEDKEAGYFLDALSELADQAGVGELLLVHHMGHSNERSRGDSRIVDWPDAVWKLVYDGDDPTPDTPRFFGAYGRDVSEPEFKLAFDPANRHLTYTAGNRAEERDRRFEAQVLTFVGGTPGCSKNEIERGVKGKNDQVREAVDDLVTLGRLRVEKVGQKHCHYVADSPTETAQADFRNEDLI